MFRLWAKVWFSIGGVDPPWSRQCALVGYKSFIRGRLKVSVLLYLRR